MAINRDKKPESASIPRRLADLLLRGFTFQALRDKYGDAFDETKKDVKDYLGDNDDGFDVDLGKGFKCDQGTVIYQSRSSWNFDKDQIIAAVKDGKVTIETIINMASFKAEELEKAVGTEAFNKLATKSSTESLTFRGTPDFKASVDEKFAAIAEPTPVEEPAKVEKPVKAEKPADAKASLAKAKAAAKSKTEAKPALDPNAELDAILATNKAKKKAS